MKPPHKIRQSMPIFDTMKWSDKVIDKHIAEIQQDAQPQFTALEKIGQLALIAFEKQMIYSVAHEAVEDAALDSWIKSIKELTRSLADLKLKNQDRSPADAELLEWAFNNPEQFSRLAWGTHDLNLMRKSIIEAIAAYKQSPPVNTPVPNAIRSRKTSPDRVQTARTERSGR